MARQIIDVTFYVPEGSLQFNTSIVIAAVNMGFNIGINNVVQPSAITSVNIVGKNRVRIVLNGIYDDG